MELPDKAADAIAQAGCLDGIGWYAKDITALCLQLMPAAHPGDA
jgi:hypothetical protein